MPVAIDVSALSVVVHIVDNRLDQNHTAAPLGMEGALAGSWRWACASVTCSCPHQLRSLSPSPGEGHRRWPGGSATVRVAVHAKSSSRSSLFLPMNRRSSLCFGRGLRR